MFRRKPREPNPEHFKRDSFLAAAACGVIGTAEAVILQKFGVSAALAADMVHTLGADGTSYILNGFAAGKGPEAQVCSRRYARVARYLIYIGAAVIGVEAAHNLINEQEPIEPIVPAIAVASAGVSYGVHRRMHVYQHLDEADHNHIGNVRHAQTDAIASPITVAGTTFAAAGVPLVDSIAGVAVSIFTVRGNLPGDQL